MPRARSLPLQTSARAPRGGFRQGHLRRPRGHGSPGSQQGRESAAGCKSEAALPGRPNVARAEPHRGNPGLSRDGRVTGAAVCDIVIPIWNQPELTQRCLESVLAATTEPIHLILIDNGSQPPTQQLLDRFQTDHPSMAQVIRNTTNLGFIRAVNQGIRAGKASWICLLNNDTQVTPGWLAEMIRVAESDPTIGLVNPTSNSLGFHPGPSPLEEYADRLRSQTGRSTELSPALGFCLLARRQLFERVGLLDESYGMGNFDDDDLSRRVRQAGLRCVRACAAYVFHEEKASFRHLPDWKKDFEENRRRFEEKWGRRLRILCSPLAPDLKNRIPVQALRKLLEEGHWLTFFGDPGTIPPEIVSHAQVGCVGVNGSRWRLQATWRLLTKRKKPFDLVVSFDPAWSRALKTLKGLYRAQLLHCPTEEEITERCHRLSRSPSS